MVMMGLGAGILISSLTTKYKDLAFMVGFGTQLLMYFSPVIFPISSVSGNLKTLLLLNPMTPVIESMRVVLVGKGEVDYFYLSYSVLFGLCILLLGSIVFNKVERSFTDTI
jgi:lipopolysaccharide transport system permease protein